MPPKKTKVALPKNTPLSNWVKREPKPPPESDDDNNKNPKTTSESPSSATSYDDPLREPHPFYKDSEKHGIVLRKFYPHEMSNDRARAYIADEIPRPIEALNAALAETAAHRESVRVQDAVVHWFKMDLRVSDNRALFLAGEKAREAGVPLIGLYVVSPQDFEAHLRAPVRVDFMLRTLRVLREDLGKLDIPLWVETVGKRREVPGRVVELMEGWGARHLFVNVEYEVDELRREAKMARMLMEKGMTLQVAHDTCVVPPGALKSGSGRQYAVYTPWYRSWVKHVHENLELLEMSEPPARNPPEARLKLAGLFDCEIPRAPEGKRLTKEEEKKFAALWPAGEHEAKKRLAKFCEDVIARYADSRNIPSVSGTSSLSVHFASGTLSARTAVRTARDSNNTKRLDGGNQGIQTWISEVAWRDFYKHVLVNWPYVCMNKPFKPEYSNIEWSYDQDHFQAWTEGRTGFPIVDAAMRQLKGMGWVHNRCRMIVASFLSKDLLLDWRMGERYFMEHLVDGDFASNNGGWGFSASVGVDPQPYFRVFNPLLQSEKFDPDGDYIRKWVPELKGVMGKAIHDPYGRGAEVIAKKAGYPRPIVEHKGARERALVAYKAGLESGL
ncbi:DNA photolyase, FAD-binding/Cryptochrome [Schizothecium vesticola]|uniref:DNA photolyase, FAD-binding/Cryptochrome n=1 Tax=Schizothecium vesticola TaxID=314040 RepID=A0AA40EUH7_9PEZI|nr:DNA photolyase, FAD-binding/Cryptochrome [Schizothecium vesticola]